MPSEKISEMPAISELTGAELIPVVSFGSNKSATTQQVSELAAPTRLSQLENDVPFPRFSGSGAGGPIAIYESERDISKQNNVFIDGETITAEGLFAVFAHLHVELTLSFVGDNRILFIFETKTSSRSDFTVDSDGLFRCLRAAIAQTLSVAGASFTVDFSGVCTAAELHAGDGFTGTGAYTNFTFKDGICTAAS